MKKKVLIVVSVIIIAAILFGIGEIAGMFPWQYIKEDKVTAFIEDSQYAFTFNLPDTGDENKSVLTNELAAQIAAVTYTARNNFALETDNDAYIISEEELNNEKASLFDDIGNGTVKDSELLNSAGNSYLLHLNAVHDSGISYEIEDSSYGLIGSEPTRITVLYKLNGEECTLQYILASDTASPYSFKVVDITISD